MSMGLQYHLRLLVSDFLPAQYRRNRDDDCRVEVLGLFLRPPAGQLKFNDLRKDLCEPRVMHCVLRPNDQRPDSRRVWLKIAAGVLAVLVDGKWIYFRSEEPGRTGVYRCFASGGDAIALAKDINGINPRGSLDGKTVYFASHHNKSTLKEVTLPAQPVRSPRWMECRDLELPSSGLSLERASILFRPTRPDRFAILILLPSRCGQFLK